MATFYCQPRQIYRSKTQIPPAIHNFSGWVIVISNHSGSAAHVSCFSLRVARFIILQIKRCINKRKVWKQSFCTDSTSQFKQVIIRILRIVIYAIFYFKYMNWENRSFQDLFQLPKEYFL